MYVGERFKKDGKTFEVTALIEGGNYAFKEVTNEPVFKPTFEEEVVEETKVKRGRKKV